MAQARSASISEFHSLVASASLGIHAVCRHLLQARANARMHILLNAIPTTTHILKPLQPQQQMLRHHVQAFWRILIPSRLLTGIHEYRHALIHFHPHRLSMHIQGADSFEVSSRATSACRALLAHNHPLSGVSARFLAASSTGGETIASRKAGLVWQPSALGVRVAVSDCVYARA